MTKNEEVLFALCGEFPEDDKTPLTAKEWYDLQQKLLEKGLAPEALLDEHQGWHIEDLGYTPQQAGSIRALLERSMHLSFHLCHLSELGITPLTILSPLYPLALKEKLGQNAPIVIYAAGNTDLLSTHSVGIISSRLVGDYDISFSELVAEKLVSQGYTIVTGGAKKTAHACLAVALEHGGNVISFLSHSMQEEMTHPKTKQALKDGKLLILSASFPRQVYSDNHALVRNRYVLAFCENTIIVKTELSKGGTWHALAELDASHMERIYCRKVPSYEGNMRLISQGAKPIDINWQGLST